MIPMIPTWHCKVPFPQCKLEIIIFLAILTFVWVHDVQVALVPLWQMFSAEQLLFGLFSQQLRKYVCDIDEKHPSIVLKIQTSLCTGKAFSSHNMFLGNKMKRKGRRGQKKQHWNSSNRTYIDDRELLPRRRCKLGD